MACYRPTKKDETVASLISSWDAADVARLRGMWEEQTGKTLILKDPVKVAQFLAKHRGDIITKEMNTAARNLTPSYKQLRALYQTNPETRIDRVNMITTLFSRQLDQWQTAGDTHSREELCNGYIDDEGNLHGGQFKIFESVYNTLRTQYSADMASGYEEDANEIKKVLDNWGAFTAFARVALRDIEGVKLGNRVDYANDTNDSNYGENDLALLFNFEEATRESWQMVNDMISAFGTLGKITRRVLGGLQAFDQELYFDDMANGYPNPGMVMDDLGFPKKINPITAHQALMEELRGISNEEEMMRRLYSESAQNRLPWVKQLIPLLEANDMLRTQFFQDFHKEFILFGETIITLKNGIYEFKTIIKNKVRNLLGGEYKTRIKLGKVLDPSTSVYNEDKTVNWQNVQNLKNLVNEWFTQPSRRSGIGDSIIREKSKFWSANTSWYQRGRVITDIANALGINLDLTTAINLISGRNGYKFAQTIQELFGHENSAGNAKASGFDALLNDSKRIALQQGNYAELANVASTFEELLTKQSEQRVGTKDKKGDIEEKVDKLLNIIAEEREALRVESRVLHKDRNGNTNTLYSNVAPSYLGEFVGKINGYARAGDREGLRKFLDGKYGDSSIYKLNGKWLNKWLEDFYEEDILREGSFAETFVHSRLLGTSEQDFEDFTSKQHAIDMIHHFLFAENSRDPQGRAYAHYPVFVLGDSGVCKYIKAKRYTTQEILDGMYNIYRSERRRQELTKAANEKMQRDGYKTIQNASEKTEEFVFLPFLNEEQVKAGIAEKMQNGTSEEDAIKDAIKTYMAKQLEEFKKDMAAMGVLDIVEVTNEAGNKVKVSKYFGKEVAQTTHKDLDKLIADFYWNTKFATMQQIQIMSVDPSFYKDIKDFQKRYKEIHAPGASLSVLAKWKGEYACRTDENGQPITYETCVYFDDMKLSSEDVHPEFLKAIRKNNPNSKWRAYLENTLTDGQGYRTLDSYRRVMIMAGKWGETMQNAYDEIKALRATYGDGQIPMHELERIAELAVVFQPIKPYMYTIENYKVNDLETLKIPVQHKYAEAVLIPELLPADSKLKHLALEMENHVNAEGKAEPIDLVCATTCVKVGAFGSTNFKGLKNREELKTALSKGYVHKLSYSDYRIQTNVPEHINSSQLFGTQLRKLIMSGLKLDDFRYSDYVEGGEVNLGNGRMVKLNGRNLLNFYNSLIVANILESYHDFENILSNPDKVASVLQQNIINNSRESLDNMLGYEVDENGNFTIPLFEGGVEHDSAAFLMSLFRKMVNKQKIKGGSAVQVSAMGIKGYEEDGGLHFVTDENDNILYAECEVPFDLTVNENGKEVALNYADYCNEDGTLKTDDEGNTWLERRYPGILDRVAYRIPTENDYSMLNLKIVRFSQKTAGGTIKVPLEATTIAGFDFDIDKLYFMMKEFHFDGNGNLLKYDVTKSPLEQHGNKSIARALRNNMLIDLIQKRLQDPETFQKRTTPGGFDGSRVAAREMRELEFGDLSEFYHNGIVDFSAIERRMREEKDPEPNYDVSDPMTIIRYNQQNQVAGKLIGIFANQNTNQAFASLMSEFRLSTPIKFCGHSYSDLLHGPAGVDVDMNVAELLAASVDAVKDPVLNYLNLNTITANAGGLLIRLGYTQREVGLLLNQPIIKELCQYAFNNNISVDFALQELKDFYKAKLADIGGLEKPLGDNAFTESKLAAQIVEDRKQRNEARTNEDLEWSASKIKYQLGVLELFEEINSAAGEVSEFITNTKFTASNSVGSTIGNFYAQQQKVANYVASRQVENPLVVVQVTKTMNSPISLAGSEMSDEQYINTLIGYGLGNPFAFEQAMYDMNVRATKLLSKYYPYDTEIYKETRRIATEITKGQFIDADTINSIHSDIIVYLLSRREFSMFNGDRMMTVPGQTEQVSYRDYYTKIFPLRVAEQLESDPSYKTDFAIFKYMIPTVNENGDLELRMQEVGGLTPKDKDAIRDSWAALMQEDPNLARDLFLYNYYKLGFGFSPLGFMHLAPVSVKQAIKVDGNTNYVDFLRKVLKGELHDFNVTEFVKQYIANHTDNKKFVYTARGDFGKILKSKAKPGRSFLSSFTISLSEMGDNTSIRITSDPLTQGKKTTAVSFKPCIAFQEGDNVTLYMAQSTDSSRRFNIGEGGTMTYVKVKKLGTSKKSLQYGSTLRDTQEDRSSNELDNGSTNPENEHSPRPASIDRAGFINEIIENWIQENIADGSIVVEEVESVKAILQQELASYSDERLQNTINTIRNQSTDHMVDQTGEDIC